MRLDALVEEATRSGVAPLLYKSMEAMTRDRPLSEEALQALQDVYLHNALRNATLWEELSAVLWSFQDARVPVILLKGAHLAEFVYGSPALRPMVDLDLLVREIDLARAERCLGELGYRPFEDSPGREPVDYARHHHLCPFVKPGAVPIEIHRTLSIDSGRLEIAAASLWEQARDVLVADAPAKVLSPEHFILHLCLHAAYNHRFQVPLLSLCDIAWSIARYRREIDWQRAAAIAEAWGASRFVYTTLLLVEETLGPGIEPLALSAFHHEAADREIVATVRELLFASRQELPFAFQVLGKRSGLPDRVCTLALTLFPAPSRMCRIYELPAGSRRIFLYYLFRPVDLLVRRGRFMLEWLCRTERIRPALDQEEQRLQIHRWLEECAGEVRGEEVPPREKMPGGEVLPK